MCQIKRQTEKHEVLKACSQKQLKSCNMNTFLCHSELLDDPEVVCDACWLILKVEVL